MKMQTPRDVEARDRLKAVDREVRDEDADADADRLTAPGDLILAQFPPEFRRTQPEKQPSPERSRRLRRRFPLGRRKSAHGNRDQRPRDQTQMQKNSVARIDPRPKVTDPAIALKVPAGYRDADDPCAGPRRAGDELRFERIPSRTAAHDLKQTKRIDPKSALRVADVFAGFKSNGEIRQASPDAASRGIVCRLIITVAENHRRRMRPRLFKQRRNVLGIELSVGVDRHRMREAGPHRGGEAGLEGHCLAAIALMPEHGDGTLLCGREQRSVRALQFIEPPPGPVGRAVINDEERMTKRADALDDFRQEGEIVVGGRDDCRQKRHGIGRIAQGTPNAPFPDQTRGCVGYTALSSERRSHPMANAPTSDRSAKPALPPHPVLNEYYDSAEVRQDVVTNLFDETAVHYDRVTGLMSLGTGAAYRRHILRGAGVGPGAKVLDVACGTGQVSTAAMKLVGPEGSVLGIDPSDGMRRVAETRRGVRTMHGAAGALPVDDASYDFVLMGYALRHVDDLTTAFKDMHRVLRPGGKIIILEITAPPGRLRRMLLRTYLRQIVPPMGLLVTGNRTVMRLMRYYWDSIEQCVRPEVILGALAEAGFADPVRQVSLGCFTEYIATRK